MTAAATEDEVRAVLDHATREIGATRFAILGAEVQAPGWAKTLSAPFELQEATAADIPPQRIRVVVNVGVTLRGRVVDARGRALAGATVTTQAAGTLPDNPMLEPAEQCSASVRGKHT